MSQSIYEAIQPLIAHAEQDGSTVRVVFRCPVSGYEIESSAGLRQGSRIPGIIERSLMWTMRSVLASVVRSAFPGGIVGNMLRITQHVRQLAVLGASVPGVAGAVGTAGTALTSAAREAVHAGAEALRYSEDDQREAIERAFQAVADRFLWDAEQGRYIAVQSGVVVLTGFMRQLVDAPVTTRYDRLVFARMLTEIAAANRQLGPDEHMFLAGFITSDLGTIEELWRAPPLSTAELAETSEGPVRETMLMLAWSVAWTDEQLAPQEDARLCEYETTLAVPVARLSELQGHVRDYLIEQALARAYGGGRRNPTAHAEAMAFAQRLGLDATTAERTDIRFRKRNGLI